VRYAGACVEARVGASVGVVGAFVGVLAAFVCVVGACVGVFGVCVGVVGASVGVVCTVAPVTGCSMLPSSATGTPSANFCIYSA
jgi:hypothetical protein